MPDRTTTIFAAEPAPDEHWIGDLALEPIKEGTRVVLVRDCNLTERILYVYGEATYTGIFERPFWYTPSETASDHRFLLDNGVEVWGVETWWGAVDRVRELYPEGTGLGGWTWQRVGYPNRDAVLSTALVPDNFKVPETV